jgi:transcriptional regulator with XRE-family HTH domain
MENILNEFGKAVYMLRKSKNLTQEKLAEIAGFDRTYIGRIERGERNITLKNIEKLAKALNVSIHQIFQIVENNKNKKSGG